MMKTANFAVAGLLCALPVAAFGLGVSPYLPLNLEPEIERQIDRVLILADKPVMTRPIAAATVLEALPAACKVDQPLCEQVGRYLARYTHGNGVTHANVELAATGGADPVVPNRYGMRNDSPWNVSAQAYIQPSDYLLVDLGGTAYQGEENPTGSMISLGFSWAQLDIGYRPHWLSPMTDSSMLMSSEAPTMPSVTLSNYEPLTRLGLTYELFLARMSESDLIALDNGYTSGHPRLAGAHLAMEPVSGWSVAVNRLMQYGGGARGQTSIRDIFDAFFNATGAQNGPLNGQFGNQQASVTSSFLFPGRTPLAIYAEYAGEDTSHNRNYLLGNSALSVGIHFPRLWERFDLTVETSEWQNAWYTNTIYGDGMTNDGRVIGGWFADQREFHDGVGGQSQMVRLGWEPPFGGLMGLRFRTVQNQVYGEFPYKRGSEVTLDYARPWRGYTVGGEIEAGRDVFGASFSRIAGFIRLNENAGLPTAIAEALDVDNNGAADLNMANVFVDVGIDEYRLRADLTSESTRTTGPKRSSPHFALGARRAVTEHSDLGTRLEFDQINHRGLLGIRLIDYRYRFNNPLALEAFLGAERYALGTPAYGFYLGAGVQWRNVLPKTDVGVEYRYSDSIARDHLLPGDPTDVNSRPDSFYDINAAILSISYHF